MLAAPGSASESRTVQRFVGPVDDTTADQKLPSLVWSNCFQAKLVSVVVRHLQPTSPNVYVNHFPGSVELGHKARLSRHLRGSPFLPKTFVLPEDASSFHKHLELPEASVFICKPATRSGCGKGIRVIEHDPSVETELSGILESGCVVSEYVSSPLLVDGLKVDLRLYVLLAGLEEESAVVYLSRKGYTRFASHKYESGSYDDVRMHLTNNSLNAGDEQFRGNWSLSHLKEKLVDSHPGHKFSEIWESIQDLVKQTFVACAPAVRGHLKKSVAAPGPTTKLRMFELFGFDILLTDTLEPKLLECNICPGKCQFAYYSPPCNRISHHSLDVVRAEGLMLA